MAYLRTWPGRSGRGPLCTAQARPTVPGVARLIVRPAKENPLRGHRRIHSELTKLGVAVAPSTVWKILRARGHRSGSAPVGPSLAAAPARPGHRDRRGRLFACGHRAAKETVQQARNLALTLDERFEDIKFLIGDRGSNVTRSFGPAPLRPAGMPCFGGCDGRDGQGGGPVPPTTIPVCRRTLRRPPRGSGRRPGAAARPAKEAKSHGQNTPRGHEAAVHDQAVRGHRRPDPGGQRGD